MATSSSDKWLSELVSYASTRVNDRVREALWSRGVTDEQIQLFQIGYLNLDLPPQIEFPKNFLEWLYKGTKHDDVYVLPLTTTLGAVRGLQFRHVDRNRTGYSDFILDNGEAVLFGLHQAIPYIWRTRSVFLVEGGFDLFPVQRFCPQSLATLTARVIDPLGRILRRLVDHIWLGYDMDSTGRDAIGRFQAGHRDEYKSIRGVTYPRVPMADGKLCKDPSDLWEAWGDVRFGNFMKSVLETQDSTLELFNA